LWTWALRIGASGTGLASLPVATAVLSRGHITTDEARYHGAGWLLATTLAAIGAVLFLIVGEPLIELAFGSRSLTNDDLHRLTLLATLALAAGVPLAMFTVSSRAFIARGRFKEPITAFAAGAVAYPVLIAALFPVSGYRSLGIAYVAASVLTAVWLTHMARRADVLRFRRKNLAARE
jgi:peptidoglycan biosynthesis protein MviN/MurJ (putative lipid II flippase)